MTVEPGKRGRWHMPGFRGQVVAIDPGDENGPVLEIRPHGKSKSDPTNVRSARPAWVARK